MSSESSLEMLELGRVPERYQRNMGTIGIAGQIRLLQSKVVVVGAGGLGGTVIELLARQGVGYLRVVDGDTFADHNLNRQLLSTQFTIGHGKAVAAKERVAAVNPDVTIEAVDVMMNEENADSLLVGMDVVVDALDNIAGRLILARAAKKIKIPMVHAAIAGFTGQVTTLLPGDAGLERLYKNADGANKGIEIVLGNPAATPALAAAIQVQEVVKLLTGVGKTLNGQLLYFDTEHNLFELLKIE